jgi:DnaD/phage-associated family protein
MAFTIEQTKELFLLDTKVENIFINEFMTSAPGDFVKVYLLSLMYAGTETETTNAVIARQLSLEEEDVLKAWNYWEGLGAVRKHYKDAKNKFNYDIEFLCIKEQLYGQKGKKGSTQKNSLPKLMDDAELQNLYHAIERIVGRPLGGTELSEIASWLSDYKASSDAIIYAYSYCVKNKKKDNHKYVGAVLKEWTSKQLFDITQIEEHLQEVDQRHFLHKRVLKAMGFKRNATEAEIKIMDGWFDEMNFSIERVLEACSKTSGISNPNFNYVNQILVNWHTGKEIGHKNTENIQKKSNSIANVHKYYDKIKSEAENAANERREQTYLQLPKIKELDEEIRLCGMEMSRIMISGSANKKQQAALYKHKVDEFLEQKANILKENGYSVDHMETMYRCGICKDSGINDANDRCSCFKQIQSEAEKWQSSKT